MNSHLHKKSFSRSRSAAVGLMTLAVLLLVFSCPVKRILNSNIAASVFQQKTNKITVNQQNTSQYTNAESCWSLKQTTLFVKTAIAKQLPAAAVYFPAALKVAGFDIHYFLSGTLKTDRSFVSSDLTRLPLFLQHLRLRI